MNHLVAMKTTPLYRLIYSKIHHELSNYKHYFTLERIYV